jgi:glyoxylase I family protein
MEIRDIDIGIVSPTGDLVEFYRAVFELEAAGERAFPFATVHRLALGPITLKIMVPTVTPESMAPTAQMWDRAGLRYFTVWVGEPNELADLTERWALHGGTVALAPTEIRPGVTTAMLIDPVGNTVEAMYEQS